MLLTQLKNNSRSSASGRHLGLLVRCNIPAQSLLPCPCLVVSHVNKAHWSTQAHPAFRHVLTHQCAATCHHLASRTWQLAGQQLLLCTCWLCTSSLSLSARCGRTGQVESFLRCTNRYPAEPEKCQLCRATCQDKITHFWHRESSG